MGLIFYMIGLNLALNIVALVAAAAAWIELRAMQKATHTIQYMPADQIFQKVTEEVGQTLTKDIFDNVS